MKYYCLGIKGSGMATLACLLHDLGNSVSGYDDVKEWKFTEIGLDDRKIPIYYDGNHEIDSDTIVTYSKALSEDHKELKRVRELGLTVKAYNEIIGELTDKFKTISVSGTHGKTTTSSLISHVLNSIYGCNYFIGDGRGHANDTNELFVIESDEFNRHFLAYHPTISVITNIELEHTECYRDINDIIHTFEQFSHQTKDMIVACGDNENIRKINFDKKVIFYGFDDANEYVAKNIAVSDIGTSFDVYHEKEFLGQFTIPLYGNHMVLNSLACIIVCIYLGVNTQDIQRLFSNFKNAARRFSLKTFGDIVTIDDYAHHPTEIKVTLEAARAKYPDKKLIAVFKPNTYSRTAAFTKEFADSLKIADKVFMTEIDCNREKQEDYPGITSSLVLKDIPDGEIIGEDDVDKLLKYQNAVICFMSCASISHIKDKYESLLESAK